MTDQKENTQVHFNTGRQYSAHGQRISVEIDGDAIYFQDHDRHIRGQIDADGRQFTSTADLRRFVMANYDGLNYECSSRFIVWDPNRSWGEMREQPRTRA